MKIKSRLFQEMLAACLREGRKTARAEDVLKRIASTDHMGAAWYRQKARDYMDTHGKPWEGC